MNHNPDHHVRKLFAAQTEFDFAAMAFNEAVRREQEAQQVRADAEHVLVAALRAMQAAVIELAAVHGLKPPTEPAHLELAQAVARGVALGELHGEIAADAPEDPASN